MKIMMVYATMSGHSKKIAQEVGKRLNISTYDIKENPQIGDCDLLFIVSGIYGGQCKPELLEFVQGLNNKQVKSAALITSSMKKVAQNAIRETFVSKGIEVKDEEYLCQGSFLFMGFSHPNKSEIAGAVEFVQKYIKEKII